MAVTTVVGYKGFNNDMTCCNGFQYLVGQTYIMSQWDIGLCMSGFHFCRYPKDVLKYYGQSDHVYARIIAFGIVLDGFDKSVTNVIHIDQLISKDELLMAMPGYILRNDGSEEWYQHGLLHRTDGPALEYPNGTKYWYQNGKLHRLDGPAIENSSGTLEWYQNNKLHRLDGPAVSKRDGTKEWFLDGWRHRTDGPAIEIYNGTKYWYWKGYIHRLDGPAIEYANGYKYWYLNGKHQIPPHRLDTNAIK